MRHATGECADGLHLLGLTELGFDLYFVRHIAFDGHIIDNLTAGVPHGRDGGILLE